MADFKVGDIVSLDDANMAPSLWRIVEILSDGDVYLVRADGASKTRWRVGMHELILVEKEQPASVGVPGAPAESSAEYGLPHEAKARKATPVATGVLAYFPDAIAEVAKVSKRGNDQHNPGQPLHWARGKSTDQLDAAVRHIMDYLKGNMFDAEGNMVLAQAAWRILAQVQLDCEKLNKEKK